MKITVQKLAKQIGAELVGDGAISVSAVAAIEAANESDVTFVTSDKHLAALSRSRAGAVIVDKKIENLSKVQLVVENVNMALIKALTIFAPKLKLVDEGIDPSAKVGNNVKIAKSASIGAWAVIDDNVQIGENSIISAGCKVGENSKVGKNSRLDCNVVVEHNCTIGNNVIIQANSVIGSCGFGYSFIDGAHRLIPHNGGVIIEDFVEIGANCCVDRAKFDNTIIGAGTKIDNLVQIAHNVVIGKCCLIVGQAGIGGSSKLCDGVMLAGMSGVVDNVEVGAGVMIGALSGVIGNVKAGKKVFGTPAREYKEGMRVVALTRRLPEMVEQLKQLSAKVEKLEAAKDNKG